MRSVESGISGLDELLSKDESRDMEGIPPKSASLIYGPPKVGKSILCNQFTYHGLEIDEPCLFLTADAGIREFQQDMLNWGWPINQALEKEMLYVIDPVSSLSGANLVNTDTYQVSKINDQAAIMVKVGIGTRFIFKKSEHFRAVLDSLTTPFAFNPLPMVLRFLRTYIKRLKEAGATVLVCYTEGTADERTENALKSLFDNLIKMDGEFVTIKTSDGFMGTAEYKITEKGIFISEGRVL
jgi:KaiC/GvpD/RAD55 family RecA-like ATPase